MSAAESYPPAPELQVTQWFNSPTPIALSSLRGKVVVIVVFQMLCPGCVSHGLPQAKRVSDTFSHEDVAVLGLHSVFEHHDAMPPHALEVFLHEYRIGFPVGVDQPSDTKGVALPKTMRTYQLRGTPSLLVIDQTGRVRVNLFGQEDDMKLAAAISRLVFATAASEEINEAGNVIGQTCTLEGCTG